MKKTMFLILPYLMIACSTKKYQSNDIISKIKFEVIKFNADEFILSIQTTLTNNSGNDVFFFEPNLEVYDGTKSQSAYSLNLKDYQKIDLLDSLMNLHSRKDTLRLATRLREYVQKKSLINKEIIYGPFIEKCIFLKNKESKILKEHLYLMNDKKLNGIYHFYQTNVSEIENKKGYEIYKNLPEYFEGYKFWKGKIKSDTLDFFIRDLRLPNTQISLDSPPSL